MYRTTHTLPNRETYIETLFRLFHHTPQEIRPVLEKAIEKALKTATEKAGGLCLKIDPTNMVGLPDRLIILPGGHTAFIELKQAGKTPRPIQKRRHQQLTALGIKVRTLDNTHDIQDTLDEIRTP